MHHPNLDISAIVQQGLAQNANLYLNSPVNFIGQRGLDRLIKEVPSWADTFSKDVLEKIYLHLIEFSGSTIPELPKEISGFSSGVVTHIKAGGINLPQLCTDIKILLVFLNGKSQQITFLQVAVLLKRLYRNVCRMFASKIFHPQKNISHY